MNPFCDQELAKTAHYHVSFPLQDNPSITGNKFMTSCGSPFLQNRNALFLRLCLRYYGPKFLLHAGHGVRGRVPVGHIPFLFCLHSEVGNSPEGEMKGGLPEDCFQEKTGWDCYQHLYSENMETK